MRLEHKVNASANGRGACDMSVKWGALCSLSRGMCGSGDGWVGLEEDKEEKVCETETVIEGRCGWEGMLLLDWRFAPHSAFILHCPGTWRRTVLYMLPSCYHLQVNGGIRLKQNVGTTVHPAICMVSHFRRYKYKVCLFVSLFTSSSSSSPYIFHGVGPLVDPFRSHVSRSLFKGLPWFLLPVGASVSLPWVIYFEAFYLHVVSSFSCNYFFTVLNDSVPSYNYMLVPTNVGINTEYQQRILRNAQGINHGII